MSKGQEFLAASIVPALTALNLDHIEARMILLGTAMQESGLRDIDQIGGGPAHGPFQIEGQTRADILNWVAARHPVWAEALDSLSGNVLEAAIARLIYERAPGTIGATPQEQAAYYKQWYNPPLGAATISEYLANWAVVSEGVDFSFDPLPAIAEFSPPADPIPADAVTIAQLPSDPSSDASVTEVWGAPI